MMPITQTCRCYLLLLFAAFVKATPKCEITQEIMNHVVCTPTEEFNYKLQRGLVSDNNETTKLTLRACRISQVDTDAFANLFSLEYLDLSQNKISELKSGILRGNLEVNHLNLSQNLLTELPLGLFDQKPNLDTLDLSRNRLKYLNLTIFASLLKLKWLDLSNNALNGEDLDANIFERNSKINYLSFARNNMNRAKENLFHGLEDLRTLNLDRCLLKELPGFVTKINNLRTLRELTLSFNEIKNLGDATAFTNLDNLNSLDLADNVIEFIDSDIFKTLKKLKIIILRGNKLRTIPDTLFKDMKSLGNVDLSHNVITTVPVTAFRGTSIKNLNLASNRFTYLTDNFCLELRNSGAMLSKFYFNQNPWQCACLMNLLDEVKKFQITYNGAMYDGKHGVCVTTDEIFCQRHDTFNTVYTGLYDRLVLGLNVDS